MEKPSVAAAPAPGKTLTRLDLKVIPEFVRSPACGFVPGMRCEVCEQPMSHMCEGVITLGRNVSKDYYGAPVTAFTVIQQCVRPHHFSCHSMAPSILPVKARK